MSSHDDWILTTGSHLRRMPTVYERTYLDRLVEPSIFASLIVLLATIVFSANLVPSLSASAIHDLLPTITRRAWYALVTVVPSSVLFAVDDWLSPFPVAPRILLTRRSLTDAAAFEAKSQALARMLGWGPQGGVGGGIVASVSYAGKTRLSRLMPKGGFDRPAGLGNLSNSCYQNSILQALSALAPLRDYLAGIAEEEETGGLPPVQTARTLDRVVHDLYGPAQNGETLWTPPILKRMSTIQQQDAQEYFCKLLNEVQEEVEKALKTVEKHPGFEMDAGVVPTRRDAYLSNSSTSAGASSSSSSSQYSDDSGYHSASSQAKHVMSVVSNFRIPLEGQVAQRIVCQSCGYSSGLSMNPFVCLTLSLDNGHSEYRLEDTLDSFSAVENIEGVQCASCTLLKFRDRIRIIIERIEGEAGGPPNREAARLKQPVPYERLHLIEQAIEDEDFEEKTLSEKCKIPDRQRVESTKSRQVGIARAPPSIAFHINRSRFDEATGYIFKNPAAIRFPLQLDLGPWCLGSAASVENSAGDGSESRTETETPEHIGEPDGRDERPEKGEQNDNGGGVLQRLSPPSLPVHGGSGEEELWQLPAQLPMVAGTRQPSKITGPFYELRAVITHQGHHENGHYVCYRKHPAAVEGSAGDQKKPTLAERQPPQLAPELEDGGRAEGEEDGAAQEHVTEQPAQEAEDDTHDTGIWNSEKAHASPFPAAPEAQWWRLSDQNVSLSNESTVLSQGGVFMLFYDRIDANSVLVPTTSSDTIETTTDTALATSATSLDAEQKALTTDAEQQGRLGQSGGELTERLVLSQVVDRTVNPVSPELPVSEPLEANDAAVSVEEKTELPPNEMLEAVLADAQATLVTSKAEEA